MWRNVETQIISDRVRLVKKKNVVLLSPDFTPDRHCHQLAGTVVGKTEANPKSTLYTFLPIFYQSQQSPGGGRVVQPDSLTTSKSLHLMTIWNQREKCFLSWKFFLLSFYKFNLKKKCFHQLKGVTSCWVTSTCRLPPVVSISYLTNSFIHTYTQTHAPSGV